MRRGEQKIDQKKSNGRRGGWERGERERKIGRRDDWDGKEKKRRRYKYPTINTDTYRMNEGMRIGKEDRRWK